jgi:hypothetical protein
VELHGVEPSLAPHLMPSAKGRTAQAHSDMVEAVVCRDPALTLSSTTHRVPVRSLLYCWTTPCGDFTNLPSVYSPPAMVLSAHRSTVRRAGGHLRGRARGSHRCSSGVGAGDPPGPEEAHTGGHSQDARDVATAHGVGASPL